MCDKNLKKEKGISLRPARPDDKRSIYNWLAHSNLTHMMLGPPTFPDAPVPDWEEFTEDYPPYFFDGSQPLKGRCFIICLEEEVVGQINHDKITGSPLYTELDIWLKDSKYTGKGYGTQAIVSLCNYLQKTFNCEEFRISPSRRNPNAIRSYIKAGFVESSVIPDDFIPDYDDNVFMIKRIESRS